MRQTQYISYQCGKVACAKMARGIVACGISPSHRLSLASLSSQV
jgi:hypothetical protein